MLKRSLVLLAMICAAALLAGCASGPSYAAMSKDTPPLHPDHGRIFFYRDASPIAAIVTSPIVLSYKPVGKSVPNSYFYVDREPGEYWVSCGSDTNKRITFSLDAGERKYVRTRVRVLPLVREVYAELESESKALETLSQAAYTPSTDTAP